MPTQFAVRILARERPLYASPFDVPLLLPGLYVGL
jgi:regulator of sirC expression with transglutaminase-like and TPR domain